MQEKFSFLKTTFLGGLVFLLPLVILFAVIGKAVQIMLLVAKPIDRLIPIETIGGIALVNILAVLAVLLSCLIAGIAAKNLFGKKFLDSLESKLSVIPGYAILKARLTGKIGSEIEKKALKPTLVKFNDKHQIGFEVERVGDGRVAIFLPGAPDPWSGSIVFVSEDQVESLPVETLEAMRIFEHLGRGSAEVLEQKI